MKVISRKKSCFFIFVTTKNIVLLQHLFTIKIWEKLHGLWLRR